MRWSGHPELTLVHEQQLQPNWCWIACMRMTCSFFAVQVPEQCALAQQILKLENCCPAGVNPAANLAIDANDLPNAYRTESLVAAPATPSDAGFRASIAAGHVVQLMLAYPATYHFIVVAELKAGAYLVNDPEYAAPFPATFPDLLNAYGQGQLEKAWTISR